MATITGTQHADTLEGTTGDDTIDGRRAADNLAQVQIISRQFYKCYVMLEKRNVMPQRQSILTRRERDVADLYWRGHKRAAVAAALGISESSIKFHLRNFRIKMGTATLRAAFMKAVKLGIIGK